MNNLNLNLLKVFMCVATSNSFLEPSKKLYISQPAISKSIKMLEDELKVNLFYRGNKGICLTPDGETLLKYVTDAYNLLAAGERMISKSNELTSGMIVIGAQSHIVRYYLLEKIAEFRRDYPGIKIRIIDLSTRDLLEALEKHSVDFVIDSSPIETIYNNTLVRPVAYLDTCFIKSSNYKTDIIDASGLTNENIILPLERSSLRKTLELDLEKDNIKLSPILEFETEELIIESVKRDLGLGFVVENAVKDLIENKSIEKMEFIEDLPKVEINLVCVESYLTHIAKLFIDKYIMTGEDK